MLTLSEKITAIYEALGIGSSELGRRTGMQPQRISNVTGQEKQEPRYDFFVKLFEGLKGVINLEWFWYEEGEVLLKNEINMSKSQKPFESKVSFKDEMDISSVAESEVPFASSLNLYNIINLVEEVKRLRERVESLEGEVADLKKNENFNNNI